MLDLFGGPEYESLSIQQAVKNIKTMIENAIIEGGVDENGRRIDGCQAKNNIIRSQGPICQLHDAVKYSLMDLGVNPAYIKPPFLTHEGEVRVFGRLKAKDQDVCVLPNDVNQERQTLLFDGLLHGEMDPLGLRLTERILSINVRSQLSSGSKNFDTLYERTFAEALNLHLRCDKMVLGEVYMIPIYEYDDNAAKRNQVVFKPNRRVRQHIEKYLASFGAINGRRDITTDFWQYERVCLLIVDFNHEQPVIFNTDEALISAGLMSPDSGLTIENMNYPTLAQTLLEIYSQRFGAGKFI